MNNKNIFLHILNTEKSFFKDNIKSIIIKGYNGQMMISYGHSPLLSIILEGLLIIKDQNESIIKLKYSKGILEVKNNKIIIFTNILK